MWSESRQNELNAARSRWLLFLGATIYPSWWLVFRFASPGSQDSLLGRLIVAAVLLVLLALSFSSRFILRNLDGAVFFSASLVTAHYFYLLRLNYTDGNYLLGAFITVFAGASCLISRMHVVVYAALVGLLSIPLCLFYNVPGIIFLSGLSTGLILSFASAASRLQLLESLFESEKRFRTMADVAPVMIWLADNHGACYFFNEVWLRFTGTGLDQAIGNGWVKCIHPDDLNRYLECFFAAFRAHKNFQMGYRLRRNDGQYRWVFGQGLPFYTPSGKFEGYVGSCVDITEVKKAEALLQESTPKASC